MASTTEVEVPEGKAQDANDSLTEQARFVAAVEAGLADADAGRLRRSEDVLARVHERHGQRTG